MTFMSWRSQYAVGVTLIDTEHHKLFDLINEFHEACARGEGRKEIQHLLNRLVAYAEEHFQHEEALMAQHGFPDLERHRTLHADLVTSVFEINEKFSADPARASAETLQFVHRWLQDHILHEDMVIADFLLRKASAASRSLHQGDAEAGSQQAAPKPAAGGEK
jgi:hemerythrin-like metal-binding protein